MAGQKNPEAYAEALLRCGGRPHWERTHMDARQVTHLNMDQTKKNVLQNTGSLDRTLRIVLGLALIGLAVAGPRTAWGLVGIIPLLTGFFGHCPLYRLVGLRTCPLTTK